MRFIISLIFMFALGTAGWMAGTDLAGRMGAQLLGLCGIFLAGMILVATRTKAL
jgi:hypothetical protein